METHTASISRCRERPFVMAFSKRSCVSRSCLRCFVFVMEIIMGLLLGALLGWAVGWRLGAAYRAFFEPSFLPTFEAVRTWYYMPATFANYGLYAGAFVGVVIIRLCSQKLLKDRIISLFEKGQTQPQQLACALDWDKRKIKSILEQLIQKGQLRIPDGSDDINQKNNERNHKMNKTSAMCAALLLSFLLFGCLPSLRPLYTDDTIVFDEALLGKWYSEDGGSWSFIKEGERGYDLRVLDDDGREARFEVYLVQLGEHRFIDLYPGENKAFENSPEMYGFNLVPAHTFMKLELSEPNLLLQWVCLNEVIEDDPNLLKHEELDDGDSILITAKSEDIQRVVLENLDKIIEEEGSGEFRRCPAVFSEEDIVFEEKLIGLWETEDDFCLDIIDWENGYDILVDESGQLQEFKGVLYTFAGQTILGLYSSPPSKEEIEAELHLLPDILMLVESIEPQLKIRHIEWDQIDAFLKNTSHQLFDGPPEPDYVFQRVPEETAPDDPPEG